MLKTTKIIPVVAMVIFLAPWAASAHMGTVNFSQTNTGVDMMRYIEDQSLGNELHEEMEDLMVKMMSGTLSEAEAERLTYLMDEYPGAHSTMITRLGTNYYPQNPLSNIYIGSFWFLIFRLSLIIWLAVGILALTWFLRKLNSK